VDDDDLPRVQRQLDDLCARRALGGLSPPDEAHYASLCRLEMRLLEEKVHPVC
jgi:hypothetical protein